MAALVQSILIGNTGSPMNQKPVVVEDDHYERVYLDGAALRAVLMEPLIDERHIQSPPGLIQENGISNQIKRQFRKGPLK